MKWIMFATAVMLAGCATAKKQPDAAPATTPPSATAAQATPADGDQVKISCTKGDETRVLQIVPKGAGCALDYTKMGKSASVSTSTHGFGHCKHSRKKIREHLEKAGYTCS